MATLPCFRCGKDLDPANGDMPHNQPYAGTIFRAHGQYGSTVFDPNVWDAPKEFLEINICDGCLLQVQELFGRVLHGRRNDGPVTFHHEAWQPDMTLADWKQWQADMELRQAVDAIENPPQ